MSDVGHNNTLTPLERKALFFHHFRSVLEKQHKVTAATEELKAAKNLAKAEGIKTTKMNSAIKAHLAQDQDKVVENFNNDKEVMEWMGLIPADDGPLFGSSEAQSPEAAAYEDGYAAGWRADNAEPPEKFAGDLSQEWLKGWHDAQKVRADNLASAMEKKKAQLQAEEEAEQEDDDLSESFDEEEVQQAAE